MRSYIPAYAAGVHKTVKLADIGSGGIGDSNFDGMNTIWEVGFLEQGF